MNDKIMKGKCLCGSVSIQAKTNKDTEQIFIDKKPAYYDFSNKTKMLTEAEVFQKYAAE